MNYTPLDTESESESEFCSISTAVKWCIFHFILTTILFILISLCCIISSNNYTQLNNIQKDLDKLVKSQH